MITDVPGVRVGHWTDPEALTGCTVVLPPPGTTGSVVVPGGSPATRETDAIAPGRRIQEINAILLTGGSAFGLGAANGVMRLLEEQGIGHPTPAGVVPIVPTAAIFDLGVGSASVRPGSDEGYAACAAASENERREGNGRQGRRLRTHEQGRPWERIVARRGRCGRRHRGRERRR
jgi:L-aminopeptidase/D-esterase-like protein